MDPTFVGAVTRNCVSNIHSVSAGRAFPSPICAGWNVYLCFYSNSQTHDCGNLCYFPGTLKRLFFLRSSGNINACLEFDCGCVAYALETLTVSLIPKEQQRSSMPSPLKILGIFMRAIQATISPTHTVGSQHAAIQEASAPCLQLPIAMQPILGWSYSDWRD